MKRLAGAQRRAHLHGQFYEAKEGRTVQEGLIEFLVLRTAAGALGNNNSWRISCEDVGIRPGRPCAA